MSTIKSNFAKSLLYGLAIMSFVLAPVALKATAPQVPQITKIAGVTLNISPDGRQKIQDYVNTYHKHQEDFNLKVKRAAVYFPLIEAKLAQAKAPEDIKYLAILESGLDAIAANPKYGVLGFWQFKEASATTMGMEISSQVDERMNISTSTQAAAKMITTNYPDFNNWMYAVLSFQLGKGGALKKADPAFIGKTAMDINASTPPFLIQYIAYVIAFKEAVEEQKSELIVEEFITRNKTFQQIATEKGVEVKMLKEYNKWLKTDKVPSDKEYTVIIPMKIGQITPPKPTPPITEDAAPKDSKIAKEEIEPVPPVIMPKPKPFASDFSLISNSSQAVVTTKENGKFTMSLNPLFKAEIEYLMGEPHVYDKKNGLKAIQAKKGDTKDEIALAVGLDRELFSDINDIRASEMMKEGEFYYLEEKKEEAPVDYHVVIQGESLWSISQKYGIKLASLIKYNGIKEVKLLPIGTRVHLKK